VPPPRDFTYEERQVLREMIREYEQNRAAGAWLTAKTKRITALLGMLAASAVLTASILEIVHYAGGM
jgi:hypothetical protein